MKRTLQLSALFFPLALAACLSAQAATKPVRVFILAGQSNMEGHGMIAADPQHNGGKGSLEFLAKDPATAKRFAPLLDGPGDGEIATTCGLGISTEKGRSPSVTAPGKYDRS